MQACPGEGGRIFRVLRPVGMFAKEERMVLLRYGKQHVGYMCAGDVTETRGGVGMITA
jgi:hypothetical protein